MAGAESMSIFGDDGSINGLPEGFSDEDLLDTLASLSAGGLPVGANTQGVAGVLGELLDRAAEEEEANLQPTDDSQAFLERFRKAMDFSDGEITPAELEQRLTGLMSGQAFPHLAIGARNDACAPSGQPGTTDVDALVDRAIGQIEGGIRAIRAEQELPDAPGFDIDALIRRKRRELGMDSDEQAE